MNKVVIPQVPFFRQPDNTHCFQAVLKMILKHFYPEEEYSYEQLDQISAKETDMWTWPMAGYLWLEEKGLIIECVEVFDYQRFAEEGIDYLGEIYTAETVEEQVRNSNIPKEQSDSRKFKEKTNVIYRIPTIEDLKKYIDEGFLVVCNVNSRKLNNLNGYAGHFVLVKGYDQSKGLIANDPGLQNGSENRIISFEDFEACWAYSDETVKNIAAFKKRD